VKCSIFTEIEVSLTLSNRNFLPIELHSIDRMVNTYFEEAVVIKDTVKEAETRMRGAITSLENDLSGIRTGRASPALVERLNVEYYGAATPLIQLASINIPEPRVILIRPFDASVLRAVERAIMASELGLTPNNDGKVIRLNVPPLTEERRRDLVRLVNNRAEEARVAIRNVRRDLIKDLREFEHEKLISEDEQKMGEEELQKLTNAWVERVDDVAERKQREIMEV
jgi:ribosome recycling factor